MPFIEIKTNLTLSKNEKEELSKELGKNINLIGKTENWLMTNVIDNQNMFFKGNDEPCAIVEVKLYGEADTKGADKFTSIITEVVNNVIEIEKSRIYVNYFGTEYWGYSGNNF